MMSCTVESIGHSQCRNTDVMHRYFDFGFSSHLTFGTFCANLEFKSGNPGLRVIVLFLIISRVLGH